MRPWDARADVFSLGVIAHELLTGRRPAASGEQDGVFAKEMAPEHRVRLRKVLSTALADSPEQRFSSADALIGALDEVGQRSSTAPSKAPVAAGHRREQERPRRSFSREDAEKASEVFLAARSADEFLPGGASRAGCRHAGGNREGGRGRAGHCTHRDSLTCDDRAGSGAGTRVARHGARISVLRSAGGYLRHSPPLRSPAVQRCW